MNNFNSFRIENLPKTRNITQPMILNRVMSRESLELLERYRNGFSDVSTELSIGVPSYG